MHKTARPNHRNVRFKLSPRLRTNRGSSSSPRTSRFRNSIVNQRTAFTTMSCASTHSVTPYSRPPASALEQSSTSNGSRTIRADTTCDPAILLRLNDAPTTKLHRRYHLVLSNRSSASVAYPRQPVIIQSFVVIVNWSTHIHAVCPSLVGTRSRTNRRSRPPTSSKPPRASARITQHEHRPPASANGASKGPDR
jgi:hypothetical protein